MDNLGVFIDNIEGLTLVQNWPMVSSRYFVSDNNFSDKQKTQVLLLKWTTILKHTNDDLIIVAILIFNSTLRTAFENALEIVESKHSTSRNQINLLLYLIYDRSLPQMYEF
jgi:hypothetical protein